MKRYLLIFLMLLLTPLAMAGGGHGLISIKSTHSVSKTLDRLENLLTEKGITIVTRWRHDAAAKKVGISLRPTELLIFGNPKLGSHFMTSQQTAGIDLPMKALAWQDKNGQVWLTYNDPHYIANRHGIRNRGGIVRKMTAALKQLMTAAARP